MAGIVAQMVGERVLRLPRQRDPVDEEQDAGDGSGLEQPLDEGRRRARLAGSGCHLDQHLVAAARDFGGQGLDARDLVVAVDDCAVDFDGGEVAAKRARGDPPFEVVLREEADDPARVRVRFSVEEPDLLAVRQEDERHAQLEGIVAPLVLRQDRVDACALGFERRQRPALTVAQHVVGQRAVGEQVFEQDARAVGDIPAGIPEQRVDLRARESLGGAAHRAAGMLRSVAARRNMSGRARTVTPDRAG